MGIGLYRVEVQATVLVPAENEEDAKNAVEALVTHDLPHVQTVERVLAHGVTSADEVAREQMIQHYMALAQDEEWRCDHYDCLCPPEAYEAERRLRGSGS